MDTHLTIQGVRLPRLIYGTAWKEENTDRLTSLALERGFRGIDTANQRRHYHEAQVGEAVVKALASGLVTRAELFLQTKFTSRAGQDARLPYDPKASLTKQVEQSLQSSLDHFKLAQIDSFVLHGPSLRYGLSDDDHETWTAMESQQQAGKTRLLGLSNVNLQQLEEFYRVAKVKPAMVQNRCYAVNGWDRAVRQFCRAHDMRYQGFSLLTANGAALNHPEVHQLAKLKGKTSAQVIFRFALEVGMLVLTGTSSPQHMQEALNSFDFELGAAACSTIEGLLG